MRPSRISIVTATLFVAIAGYAAPADAQPKTKKDCDDKAAACEKRCFKNTPIGVPASNCFARTCNPQHKNCMASLPKKGHEKLGLAIIGGRGGGILALPPRNSQPTQGPASIPTGGILSTIPGLPSRGPSAAGSPVSGGSAAPSAPPVILR